MPNPAFLRLHPQAPWLPADYESAAHMVATLFAKVDMSEKRVFHPVIVEFKALINRDPVVRMAMTAMIDQLPP